MDIVSNIKNGKRPTLDNTFSLPWGKHLMNYAQYEINEYKKLDDYYHYHFKTDEMEGMVAFHKLF